MHIVWFGGVGGWLVYSHREQHDRSRLCMAFFFFYLAFGCSVFIATGIFRGDLNGFIATILEPYPLIISFLPSLCLVLYVVEIMQSQWLTYKRFLLLLSPWMVLCAAWVIYHGMHDWQYNAITHLSNVSEIGSHIHRTDVLLRVLLAAIYFPYASTILFIRYNWRTTNVGVKGLKILKGFILLCYIGFIAGMVLRIHGAIITYFIVLDILSVYVFVIEQTARIPVPMNEKFEPTPKSTAPVKHALSPLAQSIQQQLDLQIWQNPDLDRDDVCKLLGTNYTYLAPAIHELGFASFTDMINMRRVQYIHDELMQNPNTNLSDLFFRAGFRLRTTAIRNFTLVYHCKPSEFVKG